MIRKEFRQIFPSAHDPPDDDHHAIPATDLDPTGGGLRSKNVNLQIVDHDHSSYSRELTQN